MMIDRAWLLGVVLAVGSPQAAWAHFAWLATDDEQHAVFFFGETIADRSYHLPTSLADAEIHRRHGDGPQAVATRPVESESFVGLRSENPVGRAPMLFCSKTYGLYQGSKLTYYAQHVGGQPNQWKQTPNKQLKFQALLTGRDDGGVSVQILRDNKPLAKAKVQLFCDDGHEEGVATTDEQGKVGFDGNQVEEGLNGLLVGLVDESRPGELDGTKYTAEAHYLTVTFHK